MTIRGFRIPRSPPVYPFTHRLFGDFDPSVYLWCPLRHRSGPFLRARVMKNHRRSGNFGAQSQETGTEGSQSGVPWGTLEANWDTSRTKRDDSRKGAGRRSDPRGVGNQTSCGGCLCSFCALYNALGCDEWKRGQESSMGHRPKNRDLCGLRRTGLPPQFVPL